MDREDISCLGSSAVGFWSIYLFKRDSSFFQPLLKLSLHALNCFLSTGYLKKILPSLTLLRSKGTLSVYKASCLLASLSGVNLFSRGRGLGPMLLGLWCLQRSSALWIWKSYLSFLFPEKKKEKKVLHSDDLGRQTFLVEHYWIQGAPEGINLTPCPWFALWGRKE